MQVGDLPLAMARVSRRPLPRRLQQRVQQADPRLRRPRASVRLVEAHARERLARPGLEPVGRPPLLLGSGRAERPGDPLREGEAQGGQDDPARGTGQGKEDPDGRARPVRRREEPLRRGILRQPASCGGPRLRRSDEDRFPAGRAVHVPGLGRRQEPLRLALGRREGPGLRCRDPRRRRRDRRGGAPQRDGALEGRTRLFVACANTNAVWVADLASGKAREQISIALYPQAPAGLDSQRARALAGRTHASRRQRRQQRRRGRRTWTIRRRAVSRGSSRRAGIRPRRSSPRTRRSIFILSGKGLTSLPNPRGPQPAIPAAAGQRTRDILQGSLSIVPVPDPRALAAYTKKVYAVTPYSDAARLRPARAPAASPIPRAVGGASPIRHVFYIIRENRTYDQILGDMPEGNGDPNLCLFGEDVTPNAHALAREFVLLDNFYVNAEVSYDGHAYSTGAYATDVVEKIWPLNYGGARRPLPLRGRRHDAQRLRQRRRAGAGLHLGRVPARRRLGAQLRRVRLRPQASPRAPGASRRRATSRRVAARTRPRCRV